MCWLLALSGRPSLVAPLPEAQSSRKTCPGFSMSRTFEHESRKAEAEAEEAEAEKNSQTTNPNPYDENKTLSVF